MCTENDCEKKAYMQWKNTPKLYKKIQSENILEICVPDLLSEIMWNISEIHVPDILSKIILEIYFPNRLSEIIF